jgi:hypothetical protein
MAVAVENFQAELEKARDAIFYAAAKNGEILTN